MPITIAQAVLGADIQAPTIDGSELLSVPAGTQSGTTFCLRGKGMPVIGGGHGHLYVVTIVHVPSRVDRKQRELFEKVRELEEPADATSRDFFGRVKDIFS